MKGAGFAGGEKECAFYLDVINNFLKKKLRQIVFNVNRVYFSEQEIV